MKKVLLIINTGTPDNPEVKAVRKYLSMLLNDHRVIDLPWIFRKILVNIIIVPLRASRSARLYKKLWTDIGSPLKINLENLVRKLQEKLTNNYTVIGAMRYGNPSLKSALKNIKKNTFEEITVFPLFPHYASSTTGSIHEVIMNEIRKWNIIPGIILIDQYYSHPAFINSFAEQIRQYNPQKFDHILFSYHGLPVKHIQKIHPENDCNKCDCSIRLPEHGTYCYKATCYETTRLLAEKLNLSKDCYSTSFQSRLSSNWITPFTDQTLKELIMKGKKRVLVAAPSFVADCLETLIEIRDEYQNILINAGGEELVLVESLNDNDDWIEAIVKIADLS